MKMISISEKEVTNREAVVEGKVSLKPSVILDIKNKKIPKGDVIEAAKLAGIFAAKRTSDLLPLCHPIPLEYVFVDFYFGEEEITITTTVRSHTKTGVEMEAFTATSVACLTIYDMCKSLDRAGTISGIRLLKKSGGKSGVYERKC
jgi:cyclic pyranopterin phosphate synthase